MRLIEMILILTFCNFCFAQPHCQNSSEEGKLALAFLELRSKLAITAGRCMGFSRDQSADQFARFLNRHKELTLNADQDAGELLKRRLHSSASAKSIGERHYSNLILKIESSLSQSRLSEFCGPALIQFKETTAMNPQELKDLLKQMACNTVAP